MSHVNSQLSVAWLCSVVWKRRLEQQRLQVASKEQVYVDDVLRYVDRLVLQPQGMPGYRVWFVEITEQLGSRWTRTAGDDVIRHQTSDDNLSSSLSSCSFNNNDIQHCKQYISLQ